VALAREQTGLRVGETLKVIRGSNFGKAMSGGDVKAPPRRGEGEPGGGQAQEGIGWRRRLNPVAVATDPGEEQNPEGVTQAGGAGRATVGQRAGANDMRGTAADEAVRLHRGENP
jgi:hypothetical protein